MISLMIGAYIIGCTVAACYSIMNHMDSWLEYSAAKGYGHGYLAFGVLIGLALPPFVALMALRIVLEWIARRLPE